MLRLASILAVALLSGSTVAAQTRMAVKPAPKPATTKRATDAETYSRWIEDLPVMPGLTETDGGYSFEIAQGGRLAEARLHGVVNRGGVRRFYASVLPPLGWRAEPAQPFLYRRGREQLIFHVSDAKPRGVLAVFVLSPRAGGPGGSPPS